MPQNRREVIWTPEAEQDRDDIRNYIAADNPDAATLMDELFSDAAARLVTYPMLGRPDRNPATLSCLIEQTRAVIG